MTLSLLLTSATALSPEIKLLELYKPLALGVLLGWVLGLVLPKSVPAYLGQLLFWIGVPVSIVAFLRRTELSGSIWIAPVAAWAAILLGGGLAWIWIEVEGKWIDRSQQNKGSFLLASIVGNTGYLGYPVTLSLLGHEYFGWAIFYDLLGSTLGMYGLGVAIAARFGTQSHSLGQLIGAVLKTPALWSLGFGLGFRLLPLPDPIDTSLQNFAWAVVALSLMLIGMRLSQLSSWHNLRQVSIVLGIKMVLVPLILGYALRGLGVTGPTQSVIALQMAMPPAFATLILAETYNLDRDLAVSAIALGTVGLFITLPLWLWLFGV